ncbi:MAG: amidohydrolase family protein [Candidatus Binatia bacterium]
MRPITCWPFILAFSLFSAPASAQPVIWIDAHSHLEAGPGTGGQVDFKASAAAALATMDQRGLQRILIMPPPALREQRNDYEELADIAKKNPNRFAFLSGGRSLNPMIQESVRAGNVTPEIRRRFEERAEEIVTAGAVGFGEMTAFHLSFRQGHPFEEAPPDHPLFILLAEIAARHDIVIDLHMEAVVQDMALPDRFSSPPNPKILRENMTAFKRLLSQNPKTRLVWAHVGWDNTGQMTVALVRSLLETHPNLTMSIKIRQLPPGQSISHNSPLDEHEKIRPAWLELIRSFPDRFVIGTDSFYGMPLQAELVSRGPLSLLGQLPGDLARKIGYENAVKIYRLKK